MLHFPIALDTTELVSEFWEIYNQDPDVFTFRNGIDMAFENSAWGDASWYDLPSEIISQPNKTHDLLGELFKEWVSDRFVMHPEHILLNKVRAGYDVKPHVDGGLRTTIVFVYFGIDNFRPTTHHFEGKDYELPYYPVVAFNGTVTHSTPKVDFDRLILNLPYNMDIEDLYGHYQQGNLINSKYEV